MPALLDAVKLSEQLCNLPIRCELKYASHDNFVGRVIDGYDEKANNICLLTEKAAAYLCDVQNYVYDKYNYGLLVYDAYRPRRAVSDFLHWTKQPPANQQELAQKKKYYPALEKSQLFALDYLSQDSIHCYGNAVDLVLVSQADSTALDMGACFDFFGTLSHTTATAAEIGEQACQYRQILAQAMQEFGFQPYHKEFWHFSHPLALEVDQPIDVSITSGQAKIII